MNILLVPARSGELCHFIYMIRGSYKRSPLYFNNGQNVSKMLNHFVVSNNECGQRVAENCTYFENPSNLDANSECKLTVCPCNNNICRLRLDFDMFTIAPPTADITVVGKALAGALVDDAGGAAGALVTARGQCQQDTFSVSGATGRTPVICGKNKLIQGVSINV